MSFLSTVLIVSFHSQVFNVYEVQLILGHLWWLSCARESACHWRRHELILIREDAYMPRSNQACVQTLSLCSGAHSLRAPAVGQEK